MRKFLSGIQTIIEGTPLSFETEHRRKDGSLFPVSVSASLVQFSDRPPLILAIETDITERRIAQANQLALDKHIQQAEKIEAVGILAGGIAHDFNNLLGVMVGSASFALMNLELPDEARECLTEIEQGVKEAQGLTHQLLTFAQGGSPIKKRVDLNRVVRESAQFTLQGEKAQCELDLCDGLWTADVDSGQLGQAISNLIENACQAMPGGGVVRIRTENLDVESQCGLPLLPRQYVKVTIQDDGLGISEEKIQRVFDPYFSTKDQGSGLGLATTYSVIKQHEGHIEVESVEGEGATFRLYLPAISETIEDSPQVTHPIHQGQGRVLVMDDNIPVLRMIERILKRMGYEVCLSQEGSEAIDRYRESLETGARFDLVILDLTVPGGIGGAATMAELLKIDPRVRAIVSSGYGQDPVMSNHREYGFSGVIPKPYTMSEFSDLLNELMS